MRDFTLYKYGELLAALQQAGYAFLSFEEYLTISPLPDRFVILRHDIDKRAERALCIAEIEKRVSAHASYYFRCVPESNKQNVIRQIAAMGFEIGYHYEDLSLCNGDMRETVRHFGQWLAYFRRFYQVKTICMHGSPRLKQDNRDLWKMVDYRAYGIIGEPYFDTDFSDVVYLTDTGRRWDGYRVSVRDKIPQYQEEWTKKGWVYNSTDDIINAIKNNMLPSRIMMTTHPQRWTANVFAWLYEALRQSAANIIKRVLIMCK